jgi:hypothetical protein
MAAPAAANTCTATAAGSQISFSFGAAVRGLTLTGTGQANPRGRDHTVSLTVHRAGSVVYRFSANMSTDYVYTAIWSYGAMVKGVRHATLITKDGKHNSGTVDGRKLLSLSGRQRSDFPAERRYLR